MSAYESSAMMIHSGRLRHGGDLGPARVRQMASLMGEYDIVHQHAFNPAVAAASVISRSRVVYTEHGNFGFGRDLTCSDRVLAQLRNVYLNRFVRHVTFNSVFTRRAAQTRYGLERTNTSVIYNGIEFPPDVENAGDQLERAIEDALTDRYVIGTTSRFAGFKRVDRLIHAFARFRTNKPALLLLVGDGPLRPAYVDLVDELGLNEHVLFTGFQANVADLQRRMDVCVFPSENEPFGLVAVETLALGKPTIVFNDGGGITEIVRRHHAADVVDGVEGLVDRLNDYYHYPDDEGNVNARKSVARFFDIRRMATEMASVYEAVLGGVPAAC